MWSVGGDPIKSGINTMIKTIQGFVFGKPGSNETTTNGTIGWVIAGDHPFSEWSSPKSNFPTKSQFSPISKIWYMHFQRIFFVQIKHTAVI